MYYVFGHRLYGKVDAIPGVGHVATKFFHIDYLPLVPTESWLVTQQSGKSWRGVKIPLSAKSVFVGWARAIAVLAGIGLAVGAIATAAGGRSDGSTVLGLAGAAAACGAFYGLISYLRPFKHASYARACQLAKLAKMNDHGMAALAKAYGQAVPDYGFQPVMATAASPALPVTPSDGDMPIAMEIIEDEHPSPADEMPAVPQMAAPKAAAPLRGY